MPNPVAVVAKVERELPPDLDSLVRKAMTSGNVAGLKQALLSTQKTAAPAPAPAPAPTPVAAPPAAPAMPMVVPEIMPLDVEALEIESPIEIPVPVPPEISPIEVALQHLAERTLQLLEGDPEDRRTGLYAIERKLQQALQLLPPRQADLPPVRLPYLLVVEGGYAPELLSSALQLDLPTARMLMMTGGPKIARRGQDRADLERQVARAALQGIRAQVFERAQLLTTPETWCVLGKKGDDWLVHRDALWENPPEPGSTVAERQLPMGKVHQVAVGEVVSQIWKGARESSRWERKQLNAGISTERRSVVVDLHGDAGIFRLVEGVVDMRSLGEYPSARLGLKQFVSDLETAGSQLLPRRVCSTSGGEGGGSGWPIWEEYSRICWHLDRSRERGVDV